MSKSLPFFKMYPKDFDTDEAVRLLDMRETGLYLFCLNHAWINDGLPGEPEEIARALKIPYADFKTAWVRVSKCFSASGGRLTNKRQEEERRLAIEKSEKASKSVRTRYEREANALLESATNVGQTYNERTTNGLRDSNTNVGMDSRARADFNAVGDNGYERTYERTGNVEHSYEERRTNDAIRASESESVSKDLNSIPAGISKNSSLKLEVVPVACQFDPESFDSVWQRWKRQRKNQAFDAVARTLISRDGFNWQRFHERAELYVRHCEAMSPPWQYASLTLWEWVEGGMVLPPSAEPPKEQAPRRNGSGSPKHYWTEELNAQADALEGEEQRVFVAEAQARIDEMNRKTDAA